ncbi:hypothetical protein [Oryzobacter telluris]|uniref:hypothetical protein n=1 Tax=Oryzobacter telluris TaxID=3149179 RepID=UPI00370D20D5
MSLPTEIRLSAFTDAATPVEATLDAEARRWGVRGSMLRPQRPLAPPAGPDPGDWRHPDVGYGVLLPDDDLVPVADRAVGADAPAAVRHLLAERPGAVVLRYRPDLGTDRVARYLPDGRRQDLEVGVSVFGTGPGRIPRFVLVVGPPTQVPWTVQLSLNRRHFVGRLDLGEAGLERYVEALLADWAGARPAAGEAVVWSTAHDAMTRTMDITVAAQVQGALATDSEITVHRFAGPTATLDTLRTTLAERRPGLVVTSSHGMTAPLDDLDAMRATLGVPVDQTLTGLDPAALLEDWSPGGAVWVAQACCSAGSNLGTSYTGLLPAGSVADRVVAGVAALGPQVSPLPRALLEADPPLAAFVGHVEPTFDWTLVVPDTGQHVVTELVRGVYPRLFSRQPVGLALAEYYAGVGALYGKLSDARDDVDAEVEGARERATYYKLTALDRESLVVLGDPTVMVGALPSQQ